MAGLLGAAIDGGRLRLDGILGLGAYGVVYRATDLITGETFAVKTLATNNLTPRQALFQQREVSLHIRASRAQSCDLNKHTPSVVPLRRLVRKDPLAPHALFVVLDLYPDGDLFTLIADQRRFINNNSLITSVFLQLIDAVALCHKNAIFHRDLKPENILCRSNPRSSGRHDDVHVVLADFGLATDQYMSYDWGCGSSFYMSPECHGQSDPAQRRPYASVPNDVWSLGVILVNLVCARNPWRQASMDDQAFAAYVQNANIIQSLLPVSDACAYILKRIFTLDPLKRISLGELRKLIPKVSKWALTEEEVSHRQKLSYIEFNKPSRENSNYNAHHNIPSRHSSRASLATDAPPDPHHLTLVSCFSSTTESTHSTSSRFSVMASFPPPFSYAQNSKRTSSQTSSHVLVENPSDENEPSPRRSFFSRSLMAKASRHRYSKSDPPVTSGPISRNVSSSHQESNRRSIPAKASKRSVEKKYWWSLKGGRSKASPTYQDQDHDDDNSTSSTGSMSFVDADMPLTPSPRANRFTELDDTLHVHVHQHNIEYLQSNNFTLEDFPGEEKLSHHQQARPAAFHDFDTCQREPDPKLVALHRAAFGPFGLENE